MKYKLTPKRFLTGVLLIIMLSVSFDAMTNGSGPSAGYTYSPYSNNQHCGQSGCHSTSINTQTTYTNNIYLTGSYIQAGGYAADSTYSMKLKYVHVGKSKFGFQLVPLYASGDSMAGSITQGTGSQVRNHTVGGQAFKNLTHTSSGTSGNDSIEWNFTWKAPSRIVGTIEFYVVINATNNNNQSSGDLIIFKKFEITPGGVPEATITADTNIICNGASLQFYGSATDSATDYEWRFPSGNPSTSTAQNPVVTYSIQGNHKAYMKAKNKYGFGQEDTFDLTVRPTITAFIAGPPTLNICPGDSVRITANAVAGQTYIWQNGVTGNSVWAKDSGNYQVTASRFGCDKQSNIIRVNLRTKPVATLSSDASAYGDTACLNSALELQATSGFDSFYYYDNVGKLLNRSASNTYMTTFTGATSYGLKVRSSLGCMSDLSTYDVAERQRLAAPMISCDSSTSNSVRYAWTVGYPTTGFEVSIDSGKNWMAASSGTTGLMHEITGLDPEERTELWVRAFDDLPCATSTIGTKVCFSDTCNSLNFQVEFPTRACSGDDVEIVVHGLKDSKYAVYFGIGGPSTDTIFSVTPTTSITYNLAVQDSNFLVCPLETVNFTINVDNISANTVSFDKSNYCEGDEVMVMGETGMDSYTFFVNETEVQSGANSTYTTSDLVYGDSVRIELTKGACLDEGSNTAAPVDSMPQAGFTYERFGPNFVFTPIDGDLMNYHWSFGDGDTSIDQEPVHDYSGSQSMNMDVVLVVTNANGCTNSDTMTVSIPDMSSIQQLKALGLDFYPNPVGDELRVTNKTGKPVQIRITDINGKLIYEDVITGVGMTIPTVDWSKGTYLIELTIDDQRLDHKIIKN